MIKYSTNELFDPAISKGQPNMRLQVAIACFLVLFGAVELLQWFQKRNWPMPAIVLAGFALSLVSNYDKLPLKNLRRYLTPSESE